MNKRLLVITVLVILLMVGAAAASAQDTGAGLSRSYPIFNWAMSKGDIVDLLIEVPPDTIQAQVEPPDA